MDVAAVESGEKCMKCDSIQIAIHLYNIIM